MYLKCLKKVIKLAVTPNNCIKYTTPTKLAITLVNRCHSIRKHIVTSFDVYCYL